MASSTTSEKHLVINKVPSEAVLNTIPINNDELYLTPKGSSSNPVYSVGTTAPSNTNLFWIDTSSGIAVLKYYTGSAWVNVGSVWS